MKLLQTPTFIRQTKKLHPNQKENLKTAISQIITNPYIGVAKKGDLNGVYVYKFKMVQQLTLLAYQIDSEEQSIILLALGSHENFYRDIK